MHTSKIENYLSEMEGLVSKHTVLNEKISSATIGWHLEHTLLVLEYSLRALPTSIIADYKPKNSLRKTIILFTRKIPRGVAKAPKGVRPNIENIKTENLYQRIAVVKKLLADTSILPKNHFFPHPFFGDLRLKNAIKFLEIHTNHHLKIVREMVGKDI